MLRHFLLLALIVIGCAAPDKGSVRIIGHGGSGADSEHPMNTLDALYGGLRMGLDGIELDVQLTADSVLVAYHDAELAPRGLCKGKINANTWEALSNCPVVNEGKAYPIVRVDSLLARNTSRYPRADFTFDCKLFTNGDWWWYMSAFADRIAALDSTAKGRIVVECQVTDFLDVMRRTAPNIGTYYYAKVFEGAVDTALAHHCAGITIHNDLITAAQVTEAKKRGLAVTLFGVAAFGQGAALAKDPDRLQTDAPSGFAR